jgi:hypothetical protein
MTVSRLTFLGDRHVVVADDQADARIERDAPLLKRGDDAKAVPFAVEHPVAAIEWRIGKSRQRGLELLRELGLAWHQGQDGMDGVLRPTAYKGGGAPRPILA